LISSPKHRIGVFFERVRMRKKEEKKETTA